MSERERLDHKERLKKLELKIWDKKENIAKWIAIGIGTAFVAMTLLIMFYVNY